MTHIFDNFPDLLTVLLLGAADIALGVIAILAVMFVVAQIARLM